MLKTRVAVPTAAKSGDLVEVKTLISHPMHTGFQYDNRGARIPRNILTDFVCRYGDKEVFRARFHPSVAANPYLTFFITAQKTAPVELVWTDQNGEQTVVKKTLTVQNENS